MVKWRREYNKRERYIAAFDLQSGKGVRLIADS